METRYEAATPAAPASSAVAPRAEPSTPATSRGGYLGQFDSYRVVACGAVVLQHSLLWTLVPGEVVGWAFVMLLHFSRTAFFFLSALLLTYSQITRPRSTWGFWRRRYVQLGVPYLAWTVIYVLSTVIDQGGSWGQIGSELVRDLEYGYYQLYFTVVLFQLFLIFPLLLRLIQATRHHAALMTASLCFALVLAADLHWPGAFGPVGHATTWIERYWPWSRDLLTYQEQFVAGILVALHFDQVRDFVERWLRQIISGAVVIGVAATLWYLIAVWVGSGTGRASDLYQPVAFLWFTAAVAALECGTWWWYRRTLAGHPPRWRVWSATYLSNLTGGIYLSHVLFIGLLRSALGTLGVPSAVGWFGEVVVLYVTTLSISALLTALVLRTPLRWVLGGPVRSEQRRRLGRAAMEVPLAEVGATPAPAALGGHRPVSRAPGPCGAGTARGSRRSASGRPG